jgi:hypothetical protein
VKKKIVGAIGALFILISLTAMSCDSGNQRDNSEKMMEVRNAKVASIVLCGQPDDGLECANLRKKLERDEDPNRITYVYLVSQTGTVYGYYVAKGKISSNQSQLAPEDQPLDICPRVDESCWTVMQAPNDNGSSGPDTDGIFFFTPDGNMIETNVDFIKSDRPMTVNVPLISK